MLTPEERSMQSRMAAYILHSQVDSRAHTQKARDALRSKFEKDVDPEGILPEAERLRRAECARKAHYTRMALKSAQARRKRKA